MCEWCSIDELSNSKMIPSGKRIFQISKFGGLTRAKQAVELCSSLGIAMTIEVSNQYCHHCHHYIGVT